MAGQYFITGSYNESVVLSLLPFTPLQYHVLCPYCIRQKNFDNFKTLVRYGAIIPVLQAKYSAYPEPVRDFILTQPHLSSREFLYFRSNSIPVDLERHKQGHRLIEELGRIVESRRNSKTYRDCIGGLSYGLMPYPATDIELLQIAKAACERHKLAELKSLARLSTALHKFRSAQVFNGAQVLDQAELQGLPHSISAETDEALRVSEDLQAKAAMGLGIQTPRDLPLEAYIEIARDYQPRITEVMKSVTSSGERSSSISLSKNISNINAEIGRLKNTRRYAFLEACIGL